MMKFSPVEVTHIIKAWFFVSLAFAIVFVGASSIFSIAFPVMLIISAITVGMGFVLHELAHKYFAQKYGAWAEFRSSSSYLYFGVLLAFLGIIFILPGAVMIQGHLSKKRMGIIAIAGPVMNIVIGSFFLTTILLVPITIIQGIGYYGMLINFWLALFNMLPLWMLDGLKVWRWNKIIYGITLVLCIIGAFGAQRVLPAPLL